MSIFEQQYQAVIPPTGLATLGDTDPVRVDLRRSQYATVRAVAGRLAAGTLSAPVELICHQLVVEGRIGEPLGTIHARVPVWPLQSGTAEAATPVTLAAAAAAGAKKVQVSALTGFAAGDQIAIVDDVDPADLEAAEWARVVRTQTDGSDLYLHLDAPLLAAWPLGAALTNRADRWSRQLLIGRHAYEIHAINRSDKSVVVAVDLLIHNAV